MSRLPKGKGGGRDKLGVRDYHIVGFPDGSDGKESTSHVGDAVLVPVSGRSPEERNGYPLQYFCLENCLDRGIWWATVHGFSESRT